jgi:hypothetical protein
MARSASSSYIQYGMESTFGGGNGTLPMLFGKEQKINGLEFNPNLQPLAQLNTPEVECFVNGRNEGKCSMEYVLANPWMLSSIFGNPASALDTGARYDHVWTSVPATNATIKDIASMHLEIGFDALTADVIRNAKGVVCPSLGFKMSLNEPIRITQELIWGNEDAVGTSLDASVGSVGSFTPYTFVHASIQLPSATTIATVQDFDINFDTGAELLYELGSADAVGAWRKILTMTGKLNLTVLDKTHIDAVMARTEVASLVVTISNGLSGDSLKDIVMTFTGIGLALHTNSGFEPGELVLENVDFQCRSVSINAKNNTSAQP